MLNDDSFDIQQAKIEELKRLFPEVVTEGGIDFEALKATLGGDIDNAKEKYRFTWNGKSELFSLINRKTKGTLKPDVKKSGGYTLHTLTDDERVFVFCFDAVVKEDIAKLLPQNAKFTCLDKSLTDSVKLNIVAQIGPENVETI